MHAIEMSWLRWLFVMVVAGLAVTLALVLGFYQAARGRSEDSTAEELEEYAAGIQVARRPIPLLLVLLFVGMALYMIGYVVYVWQAGVRY